MSPDCAREDRVAVRSKFVRGLGFVRLKALELFLYNAYVKLLLETNETMVLAAMSELEFFDTSSAASIISLLIAFIV
jgi:hypothetical protein